MRWGGVNDLVRCLLVQPDGKVVLGGQFTTLNGVARSRIGRLLSANGALDDGFRASTISLLASAGPDDLVRTLALDREGRILIGGAFTKYFVGQLQEGTPNPTNYNHRHDRGRVARIGGL